MGFSGVREVQIEVNVFLDVGGWKKFPTMGCTRGNDPERDQRW